MDMDHFGEISSISVEEMPHEDGTQVAEDQLDLGEEGLMASIDRRFNSLSTTIANVREAQEAMVQTMLESIRQSTNMIFNELGVLKEKQLMEVQSVGLKLSTISSRMIKVEDKVNEFTTPKVYSAGQQEEADVLDQSNVGTITRRASRPQAKVEDRTRSISPKIRPDTFVPRKVDAVIATSAPIPQASLEEPESGTAQLILPQRVELVKVMEPLIQSLSDNMESRIKTISDRIDRISMSATPRVREEHDKPDDVFDRGDNNSSEDDFLKVVPNIARKNKRCKERKTKHEADSSSDDDLIGANEVLRGIKALDPKRRSAFKYLNTPAYRASMGSAKRLQAVDMRKLPTMEDVCLSELKPPNTLAFFKKFDRLQQNYPEELKMATYLHSRVYAMVSIEARKFSEFDEILGDLDILDRGEQLLSNDQIREVIRWCNQPKTKDEMEECMATSVWDKRTIDKFENADSTFANFPEFINEVAIYNKNFDSLIQLIVGKRSKKWLPKRVDGGNGKDHKDKGMVQFYFQGFPNEKLCWRIWRRIYHDENTRKSHCRTFDTFREAFMDALEDTQKLLLKEKECKGIRDIRYDPTAPKKTESFGTSKRIKANINAAMEEPEEVYEDDWEADDDIKFEDFAASDDERLEKMELEQKETKEEISDDDWINAVLVDPKNPSDKKSMPCFKMAKMGKCQYGNDCAYSHDPIIIDKYKKLKSLGPDLIKGASNNMQRYTASNKFKTPAAPAKPTSILKAKDGEGTRRVT